MLNIDGHTYEDWQDLFKTCFARTNKYERIDIGEKGDTVGEQYVPLDKSNRTIITVRYFRLSGHLIELLFDSPLTPGYSKMQARAYFYKYDFTPGESYGPPGLEFIDLNAKVIYKQLSHGLKGREEQYYKNGKLIKSKIFFDYNDEPEHPFPWTEDFEKKGFWSSIKDIFSKEVTNHKTTIKTVDLKTIFGGLKNGW